MAYRDTIHFVSGNQAKFQEVSRYITTHLPEIAMVQQLCDVTEIQGLDHKAVAIDKACRAWQHVQAPILIDDAGIYFEKYNNFPGVLTKFVCYGIGLDGIMRLVNIGDRAEFILYLVYCTGPTSEDCVVFEGRCPGTIFRDTQRAPSPDFPYDVLFSPDGTEFSYAQMREEGREEEFSYRIDALKKFVNWLQLQ